MKKLDYPGTSPSIPAHVGRELMRKSSIMNAQNERRKLCAQSAMISYQKNMLFGSFCSTL